MYRTEPGDLPKKIVCDFFKADFQKMKEHLNIDRETIFEECGDDIDSVWNKFINKYIDAERECIPSKTIKLGKKFYLSSRQKNAGEKKEKIQIVEKIPYYCRCRNQVFLTNKESCETTGKGYRRKI